MVRTTLLILAAAVAAPAAAQNTSTQCRWIGNVWSCDSQTRGQQPPAPVDQGAVMRSGADIVRPIEPAPRPMPQYQPARDDGPASEPAPVLNPDGGLRAFDQDLVGLAVSQCKQELADMADNKPLGPDFMWRTKPPELRRDYMMICLAYSKGHFAGAQAARNK